MSYSRREVPSTCFHAAVILGFLVNQLFPLFFSSCVRKSKRGCGKKRNWNPSDLVDLKIENKQISICLWRDGEHVWGQCLCERWVKSLLFFSFCPKKVLFLFLLSLRWRTGHTGTVGDEPDPDTQKTSTERTRWPLVYDFTTVNSSVLMRCVYSRV